jgi:hypothetical protein
MDPFPQVQKWLVEKYGLHPAESKSDLMSQVIFHCNDLQSLICKEADKIRDNIRPKVLEDLDIETPEFTRLVDVARMKMGGERVQDKIKDKVTHVETSMDSYQKAAKEIRIPEPKENPQA